jgi:hypothetical protein
VASIDVSAVTTEIAAQLPALASVGVAILSIYVALAAFKWVRQALMGVESDFDWNDSVDTDSMPEADVVHPDEDEPNEWSDYEDPRDTMSPEEFDRWEASPYR